ncbi:MAG: sigma-54-dependent Fis family transcriptional regulator [Bdellovibrionales bacterium]|nr:sigma-54-dependent Fis family transcriptional regulator [Bdellovibrionales bacterium]
MSGQILIAEDDNTSRELLSRVLAQAGYAVVPSVDGEDALRKISAETEVAIVDLRMPKVGGFTCIEEMRKRFPDTPIIVVSSAGTKDAVQAMKAGAFSFVQKPFDRKEILSSLEEALQSRSQHLKARERNTPLPSLLPVSSSVRFEQRLLSEIEKLNPEKGPLLIQAGKGAASREVTRFVHNRCFEEGAPYVVVDFSSLSVRRGYSELFGTSSHTGKIELATGGTLVLHEIGRCPYRVQELLIERLESEAIDCWLMCTSTLPLEVLIERKFLVPALEKYLDRQFISCCPLRERRASIATLVRYFLEQLKEEWKLDSLEVDQEVVNALIEYEWPGNEEQLYVVLERASTLARNRAKSGAEVRIELQDIFFEECESSCSQEELIKLANLPLKDIESYFIQWQLRKHKGNKSKAARSLGITDRTIFNKVQKYSVEKPS